jgi:hypothetical protein
VPHTFDGEKMGDSRESRESSLMPKEVSSSNGVGRVARDERAIANVGFLSFVISLQDVNSISIPGAGSLLRPTTRRLAS